jgi:hypothetical protein
MGAGHDALGGVVAGEEAAEDGRTRHARVAGGVDFWSGGHDGWDYLCRSVFGGCQALAFGLLSSRMPASDA